MDPDEPAPAVDPNDPTALLAKLQADLAAQQAQAQSSTSSTPAEPMFFGMTMTAIFIGFVLSVVGAAMANYGRKTSNIVITVIGVVMVIVPFFVTSTTWLLVAGALLIATPIVLKKLQIF